MSVITIILEWNLARAKATREVQILSQWRFRWSCGGRCRWILASIESKKYNPISKNYLNLNILFTIFFSSIYSQYSIEWNWVISIFLTNWYPTIPYRYSFYVDNLPPVRASPVPPLLLPRQSQPRQALTHHSKTSQQAAFFHFKHWSLAESSLLLSAVKSRIFESSLKVHSSLLNINGLLFVGKFIPCHIIWIDSWQWKSCVVVKIPFAVNL